MLRVRVQLPDQLTFLYIHMYIAMYRNFFAINCFLKVVKNIVMIN